MSIYSVDPSHGHNLQLSDLIFITKMFFHFIVEKLASLRQQVYWHVWYSFVLHSIQHK